MLMVNEVLLSIASALLVVYLWAKFHFSYWRRKNVPFIQPNPIFGNLTGMVTLSTSVPDILRTLYHHKVAKDEPVVGIHIFHKPALMIREPELIKAILVKDFNKFSDRYSSADVYGDTLDAHNLFLVKNPLWRELRATITPVFTSSKIKQMFSHIDEIGRELDSFLCSLEVDSQAKSCMKEVKEICALFSTDVIGTVAFGLKANSLKNPDGDFRKNGRKLFNFTFSRAVEFMAIFFLPQLVRLLRCNLFSVEASKFLRNIVNFVMNERIRSGRTRNDLIDVLVGFKKTADSRNYHIFQNNDAIVAQAAIFFTAGFATSTLTMSFALYELSKKLELQRRLRQEIKDALEKNNGQVTYEMINELEYMDMVIAEVLRMYPPLPFLDRECTLSQGETSYSLAPYSDFSVPNRMPVNIPIFAIQRDPKYFPSPSEFDPERFSSENKPKIMPFTYMPFGAGPHSCIGSRFGVIQTKVGLVNFFKNHYVTTCEESQKTMVLDPRSLIVQSKGGLYLNLVRDPLIELQ